MISSSAKLLVAVGALLGAPAQALHTQGGLPRVNEGYPRVSPDGRLLLFVSDRDGDYEVFVRDLADGGTRQLTRNSAVDYAARWSADGSRVLFTSDRSGNSDVWELVLSDGSERNLTATREDEHDPSYDPRTDASAIIFARTVRPASDSAGERRLIVRRDLRDGSETRLTSGDGIESYPSISPRNGALLFRRSRAGQPPDIYVREPGRSGERRVAPHPGRDDYPAWAFGGRAIVFASTRAATVLNGFDLYMVRADGSGLRQLTARSTEVAFHHRPSFDETRGEITANRRVDDRLEAIALRADTSASSAMPSIRVLTAADAPPSQLQRAVRAWRRTHAGAILQEFVDFLALRNDGQETGALVANTEFLSNALQRRNFTVERLEVPGGAPAVFARLRVPGATRTVTLYAHYDGQSARPEEWSTIGPWTPELRDGRLEAGARRRTLDEASANPDSSADWRIYARSSADDKGPIVALLAALDALQASDVSPQVNLNVFVEGEEERGSPRLREMLTTHADRLRSDAWLFLDGPMEPRGQPTLYFGVRGALPLRITLFGPTQSLHSGHFGNWAPNPAVRLTHLIASMRATDGRVTIAGFADEVRRPTRDDTVAAAAAARQEAFQGRSYGVRSPELGPLGLAVLSPALNVVALQAGSGANVVPAEAVATIDIRLVSDQRVATVRRAVEAHVVAAGYVVTYERDSIASLGDRARIALLEWGGGYAGQRTSLDHPFAVQIAALVERVHGEQVLRVPSAGGSLPLSVFESVLQVPIVTLPIVNSDNAQHAPNENLRLGNLWAGIETIAAVLAGMNGR